MPDINGIPHTDLLKFSGVEALDTEQIDNIDYDENKLLLDLYETPIFAASVRRLAKSYGGKCLKIRRSSDNTEQDIDFTPYGEIDTDAIATFCGSGSGFVVKVYDQSGAGNDATAPDNARQPTIYDSGSLVTLNGKPAMNLRNDAGNRSLNTGYNIINTTAARSFQFIVGCTNTGSLAQFVKIMGPPMPAGINGGTASTNLRWTTLTYGTTNFWGYPDAADLPQGTQFLRVEDATRSGSFYGYHDGTLIKTGSGGTGSLNATRIQIGGGGGRAHTIQETMFFQLSSVSRTDIEDNIDGHYNLPNYT